MEATINEKAMRGIENFLTRRGMEIREHGWAHGKDKIDFVTDDDGDDPMSDSGDCLILY